MFWVAFLAPTAALVLPGLRPPALLSPRDRLGARPVLLAKSREPTITCAADLASLTVAQLKTECMDRGLPVSGKKEQLMNRLSSQFEPAKRRGAKTGGGGSSSGGTGPAVMIVESPAKCKTIAKFAGNDYVVLASYGHVRSLPSKPNSVRPQEQFAMEFELVNGAGTVLKNIGAALRNACALLLATDPDREGEAIAWHVQEALRERRLLPESLPVRRITFSEITERAVQAALAEPRPLLTVHGDGVVAVGREPVCAHTRPRLNHGRSRRRASSSRTKELRVVRHQPDHELALARQGGDAACGRRFRDPAALLARGGEPRADRRGRNQRVSLLD